MKARATRILVVDDEEVVRAVMRDTLDRPGWYVVVAEDGEQAISLLLDEHFDILIADKNLPGITGLDVIRRAKALNDNIGTLLVTAYASRESAEEALSLGVDDYLTKPFDVDLLLNKVEEVIDRHSSFDRLMVKRQATRDPRRKRKVIVLEPSDAARQSLLDGIERLGCHVFSVKNLGEVLHAVRQKDLDALVCDINVLVRDDATACFLRSALFVTPDIKFIAVAPKQGMDGAIQAVNMGAGKVIYKSLLSNEYINESLKDFLSA